MRVLIIDDVHERLTEGLKEIGMEVDYFPDYSPQQVLEQIHQYQGLVVRTKMEINQHVLSQATSLQFIARAGAGLDNIDTGYCDAKGITYFNAGEANADAVGEHVISMLLSLTTLLQKADKEVRASVWDREGNRGWELKGKTVGIIGFGNTGKAVAQKLSGFGVRVFTYDKYLKQYGNEYAEEVTMNTIQTLSDVVTLHVPLTEETFHLIDDNWIRQCSKDIVLLNLSRGKVVDMQAAVKYLETGKLKAAAFDVLENEKLHTLNAGEERVFDYLIKSDKVVLSPHVGGWTVESYEKISTVLLQKIKQLTG
ncbi:MAG: NAD(P)-dependent oxidoreductase [Bacteroidota bacterium]